MNKYDWCSTNSSSFAIKVTYDLYRFIIDEGKFSQISRDTLEKQLQFLLIKFSNQHLFSNYKSLATKILVSVNTTLHTLFTPLQFANHVISNLDASAKLIFKANNPNKNSKIRNIANNKFNYTKNFNFNNNRNYQRNNSQRNNNSYNRNSYSKKSNYKTNNYRNCFFCKKGNCRIH